MASRQGLDAVIQARLQESDQQLFLACEAQFDTETLRVWNGRNDTTIDSNTYTGASGLLSISNVEESSEIKSSQITVSLNGMDKTVLDLALSENYQNRKIKVLLGYLDGGTDEVGTTMVIFSGRMTSMAIEDSPDGAKISVEAENRLIDLSRPPMFRYSKESQEFLHTGDDCFNQVNNIADKEIFWGRSTGSGGVGGGSSGGGSSGGYVRRQIRK